MRIEDITFNDGLYEEAVRRVFGETPAQNSFLDGYVRNLRTKRGAEDADNMGMDVREIWDRVEYVLRQPESRNRAYGLAVGRVQSGKTQNYIGLILRAIDAGWNTIILLTSKNKLLAVQTEERIRESFDGLNFPVNWLSGRDRDGNGVQFNTNAPWIRTGVNFGLALKDHHHIEWVNQWLDAHATDRPNMKMLIIDDESDYATPDGHLIGGVRIEDDDTVESIANELELDQRRTARVAAQWVRGLISEDCAWDDDEKRRVRDFCEHTTAATLNARLQADREVMRILGFVNADGNYKEVDGRWHLLNSVMNYFNRRQPKHSSSLVHAKAFIALLRYVSDYRPSHSVINAAMRVMAGRTGPANDVRPYEYEKMAYVAYTATPYANLLNEDPKRDPLAPDFIKSLRTSRKYIGFGQIFGSRPMNIVENIPVEEVSLLENLDSVRSVDGGPDPLMFTIENQNPSRVEWKSLKRALAWFVCTAAARRVYRRRDHGNYLHEARWTTMLLNVSYEQGDHASVAKRVSNYLDARMSDERMSEEFKSECLGVWRELTANFNSRDFLNSFEQGYPVAPQGYPTDDEMREADDEMREALDWFIRHHQDHIRVVQINSSEEGHDGAGDYYDENLLPGDDVAWVLCGGNVISRGLTLTGLTTSYFNRIGDTTSVDTITQMGRWFGYREGYELLPRLWMTADAKREMGDFARVEVRMHAMLRSLFQETVPCFDDKGNEVGRRPLSPFIDNDKFGILITFGRRLSGRDNAAVLTPPPGLGSILDTLDEFVRDNTQQEAAMTAVIEVGNRLMGEFPEHRLVHDNEGVFTERYHSFPYWKNIEKGVVLGLLQRIGSVYPEGSDAARKRSSLVDAIRQSSNHCWDIVFADPRTQETVEGVLDGTLHGHREMPTEGAPGRGISFTRGHMTATGFFTAVDLRDVNLAECSLVEDLESRMAFSELDGIPIDDELRRVRENPVLGLDSRLRNNRYFGFSKNSQIGQDYLDKAFDFHQKRLGVPANPILLIDFVRPTGEGFEGFGYYPIFSYYWHGHDAQNYWLVTAGLAGLTTPSIRMCSGGNPSERTNGSDEGNDSNIGENVAVSSVPDSEAAVNEMRKRIQREIKENVIIAEPRLKEAILLKSVDRESDAANYRQAISSFRAINSGVECDHTPLSRQYNVFASLESLDQIVRLKNIDAARYLERLKSWLVQRIDEEVKAHHQEWKNQGDLLRFVKDSFPDVFSGDGIIKHYWEHYTKHFGESGTTSRYGKMMMQEDPRRLEYDPEE